MFLSFFGSLSLFHFPPRHLSLHLFAAARHSSGSGRGPERQLVRRRRRGQRREPWHGPADADIMATIKGGRQFTVG